MDVIAFGDHRQLAVECAEESVWRNLLACKHITADVAQVSLARTHVSTEYVCQQSTYFQFAVCRFQHFGTCNGHFARHVHTSCIEQASDEYNGFRTDCPHSFAFHDRRNVVDLYAYIAGRVRSVKCVNRYILSLRQRGCLLFYTNTQIRLCHLGKSIQSCLEVCFLAFQNEFEIGCQRVTVEGRNKDSFQIHRGVSNHVIGTLTDEREHTCFQQCGFH